MLAENAGIFLLSGVLGGYTVALGDK